MKSLLLLLVALSLVACEFSEEKALKEFVFSQFKDPQSNQFQKITPSNTSYITEPQKVSISQVDEWKSGTIKNAQTGKKEKFINLITEYTGLGDIMIQCVDGTSRLEFVSAKPINAKGKMSYRTDDSKPVNMVWSYKLSNGFSSLVPKKNEHIKMLKAFYVSNAFYFSFPSTTGELLERRFSTTGFNKAINRSRKECGWTEEDFPRQIF